MATEMGLEMPHKDIPYKFGLVKESVLQMAYQKIPRDLYSICYDPNITTKVGTVGRICLDNLEDKWSPASLIHTLCQSRTSQAIKPLGKRTQLYAMNNIYIQSEYQVQITFLSYQECATFCLSNHWAIMTFK
uniref:UBC core domain-containing protein n=1 Tax=Zosterops lateralis melanops TaxID=1220523 RepID=A0A8D2NSL9_ZOSLA